MMPVDITIFNTTIPLYYVGYILAFPACVIFNATYYRKCYPLGSIKVVFISMFFINMGYAAMLLSEYFLTKNLAHGIYWIRVVGIMPFVWLPIALISRTRFNTFMDFMTPSTGITNVFVHAGCIFAGCCHGFPIERYPSWLHWLGIYNNPKASYLFPVQLMEVGTIAVITIILVLWARRKQFKTRGSVFPIYLILYSATRFVWEFFRDNEKIVAGLSEFNFWCIGWIVEGIVWLIVLHHVNRKIPEEIPIEPNDIEEEAVPAE